LGISKRVANTLQMILGAFPSMSWHGFGHFLTFPLKQHVSVYLDYKSETQQKNLENIRSSFLIMIYPTIPLMAKLKTGVKVPLSDRAPSLFSLLLCLGGFTHSLLRFGLGRLRPIFSTDIRKDGCKCT
jgi:hypothetical protein